MANFIGTAGDDVINGTNADDTFDLSQGGIDQAFGKGGDDLFTMGATLNGRDQLFGGAVSTGDTVSLNGDYSGGIRLKAGTFAGIDIMLLIGGFSYDITLHEDNFSGDAAIIAALGAADSLTLDAHNDTDAFFTFGGGQGDDSIIGGQASGDFDMSAGGADDVTGGNGSDDFFFDETFDAGDRIDGGAGTDTLHLEGDYTAALTVSGAMLGGVERMELEAGEYNFVFEEEVLGRGEEILIFGGDRIVLDARAVKGEIRLGTTLGNDIVATGKGDDAITLWSGVDEVDAGKGTDHVRVLADQFDAGSRLNGGRDGDTLEIAASLAGVTATITMEADTIRGFEKIDVTIGVLTIVMHDGNVAAGEQLHVSASGGGLGAGELDFDASAETDGTYLIDGSGEDDRLIAGALADEVNGFNGDDTLGGREGADVLVGGQGDDALTGFTGADTLAGGVGADRLNGGTGPDTYIISFAGESTGPEYDIAVTFDANDDVFQIQPTIDGIDATITAGSLSKATFDAELAAVVDANTLAADHAVLFDPDSGGLRNQIFLIIDANGQAGYQAGLDIVVQVTQGIHLNNLSTDNFI
jgi:Ca2+-binding RTX toxin-like protein